MPRQTIVRCLTDFGYKWKRVPKKTRLYDKQIKSRQEFWEKYGDKNADCWVANLKSRLGWCDLDDRTERLEQAPEARCAEHPFQLV